MFSEFPQRKPFVSTPATEKSLRQQNPAGNLQNSNFRFSRKGRKFSALTDIILPFAAGGCSNDFARSRASRD